MTPSVDIKNFMNKPSKKVSSVTDSKSGGFPPFPGGRRLKEHVYTIPPRNLKDFVAKLKAVVTTVDAYTLMCVRENVMQRTAVCIEIEKAALNTYCNHKMPID
jgi:hypothetical protein